MPVDETVEIAAQKTNVAGPLNTRDGSRGAPVVERARCDAEVGGGFGFGEEM